MADEIVRRDQGVPGWSIASDGIASLRQVTLELMLHMHILPGRRRRGLPNLPRSHLCLWPWRCVSMLALLCARLLRPASDSCDNRLLAQATNNPSRLHWTPTNGQPGTWQHLTRQHGFSSLRLMAVDMELEAGGGLTARAKLALRIRAKPTQKLHYLRAGSDLARAFPQMPWLTVLCIHGKAVTRVAGATFRATDRLRILDLSDARFASLSESIGTLTALQRLTLWNCKRLTGLPGSMSKLTALLRLDMYNCKRLTTVPVSLGQLSALQHLDLSSCLSLTFLPDSLGQLSALQHLDLSGCPNLTSLPGVFGQLSALQHLDVSNCNGLTTLFDGMGNLSGLQHLDVSCCRALTALPDSLGTVPLAIPVLDLTKLSKLINLPDKLGQLSALQRLNLYKCRSLGGLPDSLGRLSALQQLDLPYCSSLTALPESLGQLSALQQLDLRHCSSLTALPASLSQLSKLQRLLLLGCGILTAQPDWPERLRELQRSLPDCSIETQRSGGDIFGFLARIFGISIQVI